MTGNGTTAMYIYFKIKNFKNYIVFPSITCRLAVNSALLTNKKIIFCDVNLDNYTLCPNSLKKIIRKYKVDCVVPTHTFGYVADLNKIEKICKINNIKILEDAAQSMGAKYNNKVTGSFGDSSILSFGYSKIIDCEGGGALLTNSEKDYFKMTKELTNIKNKDRKYKNIFNLYKDFYYTLGKFNIENHKDLVVKIELYFSKYFIFKNENSHNKKIEKKLKTLDKEIENRNKKASLYEKNLNKKFFKIPKINNNSVFWRYTTLMNKKRDDLIRYLRKNNIDISSWYPPLHNVYTNQKLKNADLLSKQIINFWVNEQYTKKKINKTIKFVNLYLQK